MSVNLELWVILLGIAMPSLGLVCLGLGYAVKRFRSSQHKCTDNLNQPVFNGVFASTMNTQLLSQRIDIVFDNIITGLQRQRAELQHMVQMNTTAHPTAAYAGPSDDLDIGYPDAALQTRSPESVDSSQDIENKDSFEYDRIGRLADMGYDADDITSKINRPRAEVDLFLRMRQLEQNNKKDTAPHVTRFRAAV
ncbi:MAG: hypothetical protein HKM93_07630 [Desulfobacteraceae bacterium]|nr:hypothetical protein [Desulfobacteraceae bacterium]